MCVSVCVYAALDRAAVIKRNNLYKIIYLDVTVHVSHPIIPVYVKLYSIMRYFAQEWF